MWTNVNTFYDSLVGAGFDVGPQKGPVVAVQLQSPEMAIYLWQVLLNAGIYVNLALPPATPNGTALLRCSVCAAHTRDQLLTIVDVLTEEAYRAGALVPPARVVGG